jgi:hypothetical protein
MKQKWTLVILNLLGFLGTVVANGLANALPINNKTTGELSDQYANLFVPAGVTFAVWGVIYTLLAIFVVYQFILAIKKDADSSSFIERIGPLFFVSSLLNIGWIIAWHYEILLLSLVLMLLLLGCLIVIYLRLRVGKAIATKAEKYLVHLPFSIYLGWITIATIANVTALLVSVNWNAFGLGEQFWAVAVIAVGIAIGLGTLFTRNDIFYCLVVDWALAGILIKRLAEETVPDQAVVIASIIGLVLISAGIIFQLVKKKIYLPGEAPTTSS